MTLCFCVLLRAFACFYVLLRAFILWLSVSNSSASITFSLQLSLPLKSRKKAVGLRCIYLTQFGCIATSYISIFFHILKNHLLMLKRLKAVLSNIGSLFAERTIDKC